MKPYELYELDEPELSDSEVIEGDVIAQVKDIREKTKKAA